jgi:hypothetical protein
MLINEYSNDAMIPKTSLHNRLGNWIRYAYPFRGRMCIVIFEKKIFIVFKRPRMIAVEIIILI